MLTLLNFCFLFTPNAIAKPSDSATTAVQQNDTQAKELYKNGSVLYDEGRYEEAVAGVWIAGERVKSV